MQLNEVAAVDANTAWAVGNMPNSILKTADGGTNWVSQTCVCPNGLMDVVAVSATTAWAVGGGGTIVKTTDGGANWTPQTSPAGTTGVASELYGIGASNASTAWIAAGGGTILKTSDGGVNWAVQASGTTQNLYDVAIAGTSVWVSGVGGTILMNFPDAAVTTLGFSLGLGTVCVRIDSPNPPTVNYVQLPLGATKVYPQSGDPSLTVANCGAGPENFYVRGDDAVHSVTGDSDWTLGTAPGTNVYVHGFADTTAGPFTPLSKSFRPLATGIAAAGTKNFATEVKTPFSATGTGTRNTDVLVLVTTP